MMVSVQRSIEIRVPVHTLYNQLTQFEDYPQFMDEIESVQQLDDTHLHWRAKSEEGVEEWDAVITEQVPDQCIAWHADGSSNAGKVELQAVGPAASRLTITMVTEHDPEPTTPAGDLKAEMSEKIWEDLKRLRSMVESRGEESGAWRGEVHGGQVTMKDRSAEKGTGSQSRSPSQAAGQESGPVAELGVAQGTGESGNTAGRAGKDEVAKLGSKQGMENAKGTEAGKLAGQEAGAVAELGVAQGTGQEGNAAGREGIDEVAELGSVEGMAQGDEQRGRFNVETQAHQGLESHGDAAADGIEMMMSDRGSPGNPVPSGGFSESAASSRNASEQHNDSAGSAFRQMSMPKDEGSNRPQTNDPTQSDYSLSQTSEDGAQGTLFTVSEEVSFDRQSDEARHVGQLPQDASGEENDGIPKYDAIGKALQRGRPEPEV